MSIITKAHSMDLHHCDNKGFTLLLSILIASTVATTVAISLLLLGIGSAKIGLAMRQSLTARLFADACADEALQNIRQLTRFEGTGSLSFPEGACSYEVLNESGPVRTIRASGTAGIAIRKVRIRTSSIHPLIKISAWEEVPDF